MWLKAIFSHQVGLYIPPVYTSVYKKHITMVVVPGRRHDENGKEKKKEREESRKKRKNKEH